MRFLAAAENGAAGYGCNEPRMGQGGLESSFHFRVECVFVSNITASLRSVPVLVGLLTLRWHTLRSDALQISIGCLMPA